MERITDITKVILPKGNILVKMIKSKKSTIILPQQVNDKKAKMHHDYSHGVVIKKADNVDLFNVGDIVLDFGPADLFSWHGDEYCVILDLQVRLGVPGKYFNEKLKEEIVA